MMNPQDHEGQKITGVAKSMKKRLALIAFFLVLAHPCFLQAFELKPFNSGNQSPLVRIYGLPFPG